MSWSALQRDALEAMGFAVLRPVADATGPTPTTVAKADDAQASASHVRAADTVSAQAGVGLRPAIDDAAATASPTADRLLRALLRAAGRSADDDAWRALAAHWPTTDALRRDPAAKRALWPRLRALRRARV